ERNVSAVTAETASEPEDAGGQGSSALSRPMREDSPAARITPQRAKDRAMRHDSKLLRLCQGRGSPSEVNNARYTMTLGEGGQLQQIVVGNSFYGVSSFAPGAQTTGDDVDLESQIL